MGKKQKIGILSLGCPRNLVDSEAILGRLNFKGYPVVDIEKADVAIVNTCAFTEEAKSESIDAILGLVDLKRKGRIKKIIVCGCLSQRYRDALIKELPEIDCLVGAMSLNHSQQRFPLVPRHYAYLKICEGCVNSCSYCAIPGIKGKFASLDIDSALRKTAQFDKEKISELNIIGQDITGYGLDLYGRKALPELLARIAREAKSIGWIRLLYLHPNRLTDDLLGLIRDLPRVCKYIDLPVQHINSRILKLMNRGTKKEDIIRLIEKIRKTIPGVGLRTSLITGFPSETDKEFRELLKFAEEVKFDRLGAFVYSREEGTPAAGFKKQIPKKVKIERFNMIMSLQQDISREVNKKFLGKTIDVLIDEEKEGGYLGRSQYDAPEVDGLVFVSSERKLRPGDFVKVKINDTLEYDLAGKEV